MTTTVVQFEAGGTPGQKFDDEVAEEIKGLSPSNLEPGEVEEVYLAEDAVTREKIAPGAVGDVEVGEKALKAHNYGDDSVGSTAIAPDAVTATEAGMGVSTAYDFAGNPIEDKRVYCTAAQYAQLNPKDPNTEYLVT